MKTAFNQMGLFLDVIGAAILLIDTLRNANRSGENSWKSGYSLRWQKSYFRHLPIKAFGFLLAGFIMQFISSLMIE